MKKVVVNYSSLIILVSLIAGIAGCGGPRRLSRPRSVEVSRDAGRQSSPPPIDIMITIKDWTINQHRIIGDTYRLGEIRFAGRFLFIDDLVFKLKAERVPDWYWLVKIPSVQEGFYEIRARPYREYTVDLSPVRAPDKFKVSLRIQDRIVRSHYIVDPDPCWGKFRVSGYEFPVLYLKNDQYANRLWAAKLPREDGTWTIYITLIK